MEKDYEIIKENNKKIYTNNSFFDNRRKRDILNSHIYKNAYNIIIKLSSNNYSQIFEIGTAGGEFLNILSNNINKDIFYGFDVYEPPIINNKKIYMDNKKLSWIYNKSLNEYLKNNVEKLEGTLFIALWVFENVPPDEIFKIFDTISSIKNSYLFFCSTTIDPAYMENGIFTTRSTHTHFEYNYLKILEERNFKIVDIYETTPKKLLKKYSKIYDHSKYKTYYILCKNTN